MELTHNIFLMSFTNVITSCNIVFHVMIFKKF